MLKRTSLAYLGTMVLNLSIGEDALNAHAEEVLLSVEHNHIMTEDTVALTKTISSLENIENLQEIIRSSEEILLQENTSLAKSFSHIRSIENYNNLNTNKLDIHSVSTTVQINNSTISGDVNITGELNTIKVLTTTIGGSFTTSPYNNNLSVEHSTIHGDISLGGALNTLYLFNSTVGNIHTDSNANRITIINSTINDISTIESNITINNSTVQGTLSLSKGNTSIKDSTIERVHLTGESLITGNNLLIKDITYSAIGGIGFDIQNSTIHGTIIPLGNITFEVLNSHIIGTIEHSKGVGTQSFTFDKTQLDGNLSIEVIEKTHSSINNSRITGDFKAITGSTNEIIITNSVINDFILEGSDTTITSTHSTLGNIISTGKLVATFTGTTTLVGNEYSLGTDTNSASIINGKVLLNSTTDSTISGIKLTIEKNGSIELTQGIGSSIFNLIFTSVENNNTGASFVTYIDPTTGEGTQLNLSGITQYTGEQPIISVIPRTTFLNTPKEVIEDIIVGNASIIPTLHNNTLLLGGYEYALVPSIAGKAHTYDLQRLNFSIVNHGFASAYAGIQVYNATFARILASHIQQKQYTSSTINKTSKQHALSFWTKANYTTATQNIEHLPTMQSKLYSLVAGMDINAIQLSDKTSLEGTSFIGYGKNSSSFSEDFGTSTNIGLSQTALNIGASIGVKYTINTHSSAFINTSVWYSVINTTLESSSSMEDSIWKSNSAHAMLTFGYNYSISNFAITPTIQLLSSFLPSQTYASPDATMVQFPSNQALMGKVGIILGYNTSVGLSPYLKASVESTLIQSASDTPITVSGTPLTNTYSLEQAVTSVTTGLSYTKNMGSISFTCSGEVSALFGTNHGVDASLQMAIAF